MVSAKSLPPKTVRKFHETWGPSLPRTVRVLSRQSRLIYLKPQCPAFFARSHDHILREYLYTLFLAESQITRFSETRMEPLY